MTEALIISVIGVGTVFIVLIVMMFTMVGIGRIFPGVESRREIEQRGSSQASALVENAVRADGKAEVAAIALAVASYLDRRNRSLGESIRLGETEFQVQLSNVSAQVVQVLVDGEEYRASAAEEGLPFGVWNGFRTGTRLRPVEVERQWRSGASSFEGGYWYRRGWTEGKANKKRVPASQS